MIEGEGIPQTPGPHEGEPPRSERDPRHPTATAPESVEESVYEEVESAGEAGMDGADPTTAASKAQEDDSLVVRAGEAVPGADLDPDESADLMETREEAHRIKQTREDLQDESLITLDPGD